MKKIMFLLALLYGATLMAQNKAVAVTEVVDKEDKVSYATEIMVRTRLTAAISMKHGYTAYDRVDLQSIMSEQNFQRTGLVDDATIKRLGEMTGASLILIPEVAMSNDGKIYVAVKMLDVTTAQTLMSTGELMGSSSAEVEEGCRALTSKVLGARSGTSSTAAASDKPVTLFEYLHVFPTDIGEFQTLPAQLLAAINNKATYGYDSWRLPTTEELSIMRANSHIIPNFRNTDYLCSDSPNKGLARLVTTGMSVAEKMKEEEAKKQEKRIRIQAMYNLLGIKSDFDKYMIDGNYVYYCRQITVFDEKWKKNDIAIYPYIYNEEDRFTPFYVFSDMYDVLKWGQEIVKKYLDYVSGFNGKIMYAINDPNSSYMSNKKLNRTEKRVYYRLRYIDGYNYTDSYTEHEFSFAREYNSSSWYVIKDAPSLPVYVLFRAELKEEAIRRDMQRIMETQQ